MIEINRIPLVDLAASYRIIAEEIEPRLLDICAKGSFIGGPEVDNFEKSFSQLCGTEHCIGVDSGTSALTLIMNSLGIGSGDEVIIPACTFAATAEAVCHAGATPVFVDIEADFHTICAASVEQAITVKTRAIIAVHLYGQAADMQALMRVAEEHGLVVIEDACQAHGATCGDKKVGSIGIAGAFSFYPGKNLGAFGDAGAVVTNDRHIHERILALRDHGQTSKYRHDYVGYTARLDSIQAAVLNVKLKHLAYNNSRRDEIAQKYLKDIDSTHIELPLIRESNSHVWHLFVIASDRRSDIGDALEARGIAHGFHYPTPLPLLPAYRQYAPKNEELVKRALLHCNRLLTIPIYPEMTTHQVQYLVDSVNNVTTI
jgi:dTDP-4-amino-4,6-dideoxygalactose transaminase